MTLKAGNITALVMGGLFYPLETYTPVVLPGATLDISPAVIILEYLKFITLLQTPSGAAVWPCYIASLPDGDAIPDNSCCVYDTTAIKDGRLMVGPSMRHYGIQVKCRSKSYQDGWVKIDDISSKLDQIANKDITISGENYRIYSTTKTSHVLSLGVEPGTKRRYLFTLNIVATISQVA